MNNEEKLLARLKGIHKNNKIGAIQALIEETEKSIKHKRKIELIEAKTSGKKKWQDNPLYYFIVGVIIFVVGTAVGSILF